MRAKAVRELRVSKMMPIYSVCARRENERGGAREGMRQGEMRASVCHAQIDLWLDDGRPLPLSYLQAEYKTPHDTESVSSSFEVHSARRRKTDRSRHHKHKPGGAVAGAVLLPRPQLGDLVPRTAAREH